MSTFNFLPAAFIKSDLHLQMNYYYYFLQLKVKGLTRVSGV